MSIEDSDVVDAIGLDRETGNIVLTITDHLDWQESVQRHLELLQEKLNTYLRFVESEEILEKYPEAKNQPIVFNVVGKYPLGPDAAKFFSTAQAIVQGAGFWLTFELLQAPGPCRCG